MLKPSKNSRRIAPYVFSGSNTMVGVCLTVISIFRIMKAGLQTYADEILALDTSLFIISSLLSYAALRNEEYEKLEKFADVIFFVGMIVIFFVGILIIYTTY